MKSLQAILDSLAQTPMLLQELLQEMPTQTLKTKPKHSTWSIHEHACHIAVGDKVGFHPRLQIFQQEKHPRITALSGNNFNKDYFWNMDLETALSNFAEERKQTILLAQSLDPSLWHKEAIHPEYSRYSPYIMLRHLLLHDHTHMYTIEDLWLTLPNPL